MSGVRRRLSGSSALAFGGKRAEGDAIFLFLKQLDLQLGVFKAGLTDFQQLVAFLELRQEVGQGNVAGLHRFHDGFELVEGVFERERLVGFGCHALNLRG